jgi:prepilin-type processing-associated H-X9-DG protein
MMSGSRSVAVGCELEGHPDDRLVWSEGLGWKQVTGAPNAQNGVRFLTQAGDAAVGWSSLDAHVWRWTEATGTTVFPLPEGLRFDSLTAVSDDASTALIQVENAEYRRSTVRWTAGEELQVLPAPEPGLWAQAHSMSGDATRISGSINLSDGVNVLWVDGRAYRLEELLAQSGVELNGIKLNGARVSRGGHLLNGYAYVPSGLADVDRAVRSWLIRLP